MSTGALIFLLAVYFFRVGNKILVEIPEGATAVHAARILKNAGVIDSSTWFKMLVKATGAGKKIKPGKYNLRTHMSAEETLAKLLRGQDADQYVKVSVPEGWRAEEVAQRLEAAGVVPRQEFLKIVYKEKLEGYLYPSTYFLEQRMPVKKLLLIIRREFERHVPPLFREYPLPKGFSEADVMTLASIVEREAVVATEKPLIAAVYMNRLKKGMSLEADPTVQYSLGYWKRGLTLRDLRIDSPYNTYLSPGLPPGPICSPNADSVRSVLRPAKIDALFFVADRKGQHIFNINFNEHKKAISGVKKEAEKKASRNNNALNGRQSSRR